MFFALYIESEAKSADFSFKNTPPLKGSRKKNVRFLIVEQLRRRGGGG